MWKRTDLQLWYIVGCGVTKVLHFSDGRILSACSWYYCVSWLSSRENSNNKWGFLRIPLPAMASKICSKIIAWNVLEAMSIFPSILERSDTRLEIFPISCDAYVVYALQCCRWPWPNHWTPKNSRIFRSFSPFPIKLRGEYWEPIGRSISGTNCA